MAHAIMIRCKLSTAPDDPNIQSVKDSYEPVVERIDIEYQPNDPSYWPAHKTAMYRFDDSEPKEDIISAFENDVLGGVEWLVLYYHDCNLDSGNGSECTDWQIETQRGDVPAAFL